MDRDTISDHNRAAAKPTTGLVGDMATDNPVQVDASQLDNAQLIELVADAYWKWFERFIALDGKGTDALTLVTAN
jgi:hypothetical protein